MINKLLTFINMSGNDKTVVWRSRPLASLPYEDQRWFHQDNGHDHPRDLILYQTGVFHKSELESGELLDDFPGWRALNFVDLIEALKDAFNWSVLEYEPPVIHDNDLYEAILESIQFDKDEKQRLRKVELDRQQKEHDDYQRKINAFYTRLSELMTGASRKRIQLKAFLNDDAEYPFWKVVDSKKNTLPFAIYKHPTAKKYVFSHLNTGIGLEEMRLNITAVNDAMEFVLYLCDGLDLNFNDIKKVTDKTKLEMVEKSKTWKSFRS